MSDREWIKPGAPVVVYIDGHRGESNPRLTRVKTVATKSFTVEGVRQRIKLETLASADQGDVWSSWNWRVIDPNSERARDLFEAQRVSRLRRKAVAAAHDWSMGEYANVERLDAAIAALQAFREAIGGGS